MKICSFGVLLGMVVSPVALLSGCGAGGERDAGSDNNLGEATAEIRLAPPETRCIVLKTVGSTTVTQQFTITPGSSTVLGLRGLPVGSDTITAQAFNVACANTGTATASYVSDPVTVTVTLNAPVNVSFQMRPAGSTGSGNATVDFPNAHVPTEYTLAAGLGANYITTGPDGNLWFTDSGAHQVGRITPAGAYLEFPVPNPDAFLTQIVTGPDGNLWFSETFANSVGRMTTNGVLSEFRLSNSPNGITLGPDGNLWVSELNSIARITPIGVVTEFPAGQFSNPAIVAGADGNLWYVSNEPNAVSRITPAGSVTHFTFPFTTTPFDITAGPDGNLWITEDVSGLGSLARVSTSGTITQFPAGVPRIEAITTGSDGNLWFAFPGGIGRMTTAGVVTRYGLPRADVVPFDITPGPDGNLWFTEGSAIGKYTP